ELQLPTGKLPRIVPSLARSLVTAFPSQFPAQMLAPSKAKAYGPGTANVARVVPSLGRSFVMVLPKVLAIHRFSPSKTTPVGNPATENCVVWFASYQCRVATCSGFLPELGPSCAYDVGARARANEKTTRSKTAGILYFKVSSPSSLNLERTGRLRLLSFRCSLQPSKISPITYLDAKLSLLKCYKDQDPRRFLFQALSRPLRRVSGRV